MWKGEKKRKSKSKLILDDKRITYDTKRKERNELLMWFKHHPTKYTHIRRKHTSA
jgi:hypothetical protein